MTRSKYPVRVSVEVVTQDLSLSLTMQIKTRSDCSLLAAIPPRLPTGLTSCSNAFGVTIDDGTGTTPERPAAPSDLTATAFNATEIDLTWTDNSTNEAGFKIERCQGAGCSNFVQIATVGANVTAYWDTGLSGGTTYSYRVSAYNSGGDSDYSNIAIATTPTASGCTE